MLGTTFLSQLGSGPLVATAIHDGHAVRLEVGRLLALNESERLREEDPYTALFTDVAPTRLIGLRSRFETDLNRPREKAVYLCPEDAWGLQVWKTRPSPGVVARSLRYYDAFYAYVDRLLSNLLKQHGYFIVLDLHSYNHRRGGPEAAAEDPAENPEINVGTGSADRRKWGPVIDLFKDRLMKCDFLGRQLDVRENVKFRGGHFPQWIHQRFAGAGLAIAVEFKKFFMDEWTGALDQTQFDALHGALQFASAGLRGEGTAT
jgi:hypothetical protein